jgi:hypothetical protein
MVGPAERVCGDLWKARCTDLAEALQATVTERIGLHELSC